MFYGPNKTSIVVAAATFTLFKANTKETTKEVARPKAASPLLWWQPQAATFVILCILALNRMNIVAVTTIRVLHVGVIGHHVPRHSGFTFPRRSGNARLRARAAGGLISVMNCVSFFPYFY